MDHICHPVTLPPTKANHVLMIYGMEENVLFTGSTYYSTYSLYNMFGYWYDQYILLFLRERPKSRQLSLKLALSKKLRSGFEEYVLAHGSTYYIP